MSTEFPFLPRRFLQRYSEFRPNFRFSNNNFSDLRVVLRPVSELHGIAAMLYAPQPVG